MKIGRVLALPEVVKIRGRVLRDLINPCDKVFHRYWRRRENGEDQLKGRLVKGSDLGIALHELAQMLLDVWRHFDMINDTWHEW